MHVWIVAIAEPLPAIDENFRPFRCSLLASALAARGHQVTWWTSDFDHMRKQHRQDGRDSVEVQPGLRLNFLHGPAYHRNVSPRRVWHNIVVARSFAVRAAQTQQRPDALFVCLPTLELAEQAVDFAGARGIPVIVDVRDPWPDVYLGAFPAVLRSAARLALATEFHRADRILSGATAITAVSQSYLDWGLGHAARSETGADGVFPLGYPSQSPAPSVDTLARAAALCNDLALEPGAFVACFVGTFGASYDLETVIRAGRILGPDSKVQIVLAGDGDQGPELRRVAGDVNNVHFAGWLDQTGILALLSISAAGLVAYRDDALQSLPNKPFEYMASGLPLVSSLKGELQSLIDQEHIGLHYAPGDAACLARHLTWLAENPAACYEMGVRARRLVEQRFSSDVVYPALAAHLERIAFV